MQAQQPLVFEIPIEKATDVAAPAVKKRLEQSGSRKPITMNDILSKIDQANKLRQAQIEKQISDLQQKNESKKERAQRLVDEEKVRETKLAQRIAAAAEKHTVQISSIQDKARTYNERVQKVIVKKTSTLVEEEKTLAEKLALRIAAAAEKHTVQITTIQEKARTQNERVQHVIVKKTSTLVEEEKTLKEKLALAAAAAIEKHNAQLSTIQDKARTHNERVQQAIVSKTSTQAEKLESRRNMIMERQNRAAEKREARFAQIRETAVQSYVPKNSESMSPTKKQSQKLENC